MKIKRASPCSPRSSLPMLALSPSLTLRTVMPPIGSVRWLAVPGTEYAPRCGPNSYSRPLYTRSHSMAFPTSLSPFLLRARSLSLSLPPRACLVGLLSTHGCERALSLSLSSYSALPLSLSQLRPLPSPSAPTQLSCCAIVLHGKKY